VGAKSDTLHGIDIIERMAELLPTAEIMMMSGNKETHSEKMGDLIVDRLNRLCNMKG